ncbi:MAG: class I SAM-dependent methyltransferase [Deltaproteobacteria bacterium]|nr:class I SAM-dependent methyltransferase [Deltaproteobacteria bacterium]
MSSVEPPLPYGDPSARRWATLELPDAWPDRLSLGRPGALARILNGVLLERTRPVELPESMPGLDALPRYLLQEFHQLPNGNYSKQFTRGYALWFDRVMLGLLRRARRQMAERLIGAQTVLDFGSGAGQMAGALLEVGIPEVWALEPSPYLLQIAARNHPKLLCAQGVIEKTHFADGQFDAATASFVFHEIPPRYADQALGELRRILKPNAALVLVEPSTRQWTMGLGSLLLRHRLKGLYFGLLARRLFEPFAGTWHARPVRDWLAEHGFDVREDDDTLPIRRIFAVRRP